MGRFAACALLAALVLVAAGCGGGSSGSASGAATTTATGTTAGAGAGFQALATCLKQHGVTPPSGGRRPGAGGGGGLSNLTKAQQQALSACRGSLPNGGARGGRFGGGGQSQNPAFAKYTACLKSHGVTFGKQSNSTTFQKAQTACAKYRPTTGAGS
jgi:hypothetical protein